MITRAMEALLASISGYVRGETDQRIRPLRDLNLIPYGPRGINAPELEAIHIALCILCMASRRPTDSGPVMARAMDLDYVPRPGCPLQAPLKLATAIATAVAKGSAFCRTIELASDGSLAWLEVAVGKKTYRLLFADKPAIAAAVAKHPEIYDSQTSRFGAHCFILRSAAIDEIMLEAAIDADTGYAADRPVRSAAVRTQP